MRCVVDHTSRATAADPWNPDRPPRARRIWIKLGAYMLHNSSTCVIRLSGATHTVIPTQCTSRPEGPGPFARAFLVPRVQGSRPRTVVRAPHQERGAG